jgi:hypothetical protein
MLQRYIALSNVFSRSTRSIPVGVVWPNSVLCLRRAAYGSTVYLAVW